MSRTKDKIYVGIGGRIVAIDPATGQEIWRTKLKTATITTVWLEGKRVYGGAGGELFCLDPATGSILWQNKLKGLGMGVIAFQSSSIEAAAAAVAAAAAASAAG